MLPSILDKNLNGDGDVLGLLSVYWSSHFFLRSLNDDDGGNGNCDGNDDDDGDDDGDDGDDDLGWPSHLIIRSLDEKDKCIKASLL